MLGVVSGKATPSSPKPSKVRDEAMMQRSSHARGSPDLCDSQLFVCLSVRLSLSACLRLPACLLACLLACLPVSVAQSASLSLSPSLSLSVSVSPPLSLCLSLRLLSMHLYTESERYHPSCRTGNLTSLDTAVAAKWSPDDIVQTVSQVGGAALGTITDPGLWICV